LQTDPEKEGIFSTGWCRIAEKAGVGIRGDDRESTKEESFAIRAFALSCFRDEIGPSRINEEPLMPFDLLRDRVQRAIARLDRLPDRESDDLAEAVQECLRLAEEIWTLRKSEN
jgi:hypothetical protein